MTGRCLVCHVNFDTLDEWAAHQHPGVDLRRPVTPAPQSTGSS